MPRLAANLSLLFPQLPFPERFAAAAKAGFRYVEYQFPYPFGSAKETWLGPSWCRTFSTSR